MEYHILLIKDANIGHLGIEEILSFTIGSEGGEWDIYDDDECDMLLEDIRDSYEEEKQHDLES